MNTRPDILQPDPLFRSRLEADIVVIGSGPGGALTACLLAEAGRDVLLVEEGPSFPQTSAAPFSLDEMESKYRNGGITFAAGRPNVSYVEGRCVGGGSEINACLYHRAPEEVLHAWTESHRVDGLDSRGMEPFFEANERELGVTDVPADPCPAALRLREGATLLGWRSVSVPHFIRNGPGSPGSSAGLLRQSMTETFLPRFTRAGGRMLAQTRVTKLVRTSSGGGWQVSAAFADDRRVTINAMNVFLAAGAVQTPALLRQSGIKRNIGNSLRLHPTVRVVAEFSETVSAGKRVPREQVKEFSPWYSFGCSVSTLPHLSAALVNHPEQLPGLEERWHRMAIFYVMTAAGTGAVRRPRFLSAPVVRYDVGHDGLRLLSEGLKRLCRLLLAAGATALYPTIAGVRGIRSTADIESIADPLPGDRTGLVTLHLMGSCPMGEDPSVRAVDSYGLVPGERGLFVNDASLFCSAVGVNPQGTIMALARRNVMHFLNS
jgi:choline dehydrogenase-like flavoprotein